MTAEIIYRGELHSEMTHTLSGVRVSTDAPPDNNGKGEAFSPTDLVAAATGACALTTIGISARTQGFNIDGAKVEVTKVMASNPRRIAEIHLKYDFPHTGYTDQQKRIIEYTARNCPVMLSIHPDIRKEITINY